MYDCARTQLATGSVPAHSTNEIDRSWRSGAAGTQSDFEQWSLSPDGAGSAPCVLGHKTVYTRRKAGAECYIGPDFDNHGTVTTNCPCTADDFECATNYILEGDKCVPGPNAAPVRQPAYCPLGTTYQVPSGYRRVPATTCEGGLQLDAPLEKPCEAGAPTAAPPSVPPEDDVRSVTNELPVDHITAIHYFPRSERILLLDNLGGVWLSKDNGGQWTPAYQATPAADSGAAATGRVSHITMHPFDDRAAVLIIPSGGSKITWDGGDSWSLLGGSDVQPYTGDYAEQLAFHRTRPNWMVYIVNDCTDFCKGVAMLSKDGGHTFTKMKAYARRCVFASASAAPVPEPDALLCHVDDEGGTQSPIHSHSLYRSTTAFASATQVDTDVVEVMAFQKFFVYGKVMPSGSMTLHVSTDGGATFATAVFPDGFNTDHMVYNFVEAVSVHAMFLDVVRRPSTIGNGAVVWDYVGSLFSSDSRGTSFELVLDATSNTDQYTDVERVAGVDGVLLANQVTNPEEVLGGLPALVRTLISFNDGASCSRLMI